MHYSVAGGAGRSVMIWASRKVKISQSSSASFERIARDRDDDHRFLDLLAQYEGQGRKLSHKAAAKDYAPRAFAAEKGGIGIKRFEQPMERLFERKEIHVAADGPASRAGHKARNNKANDLRRPLYTPVHHPLIPPRAVYSPRPHGGSVQPPKKSTGYRLANFNHPSSQPTQVVIDASPSGVTKERSQSYQRPLQAKRVQTIAQTTAPTPKRPNRAISAPSAFPSIFHPRIS